jgi:hypothetical protein
MANAADSASAYVRSFNRYEMKYELALESAQRLTEDLLRHCDPDPHSGDAGYDVYSLYWDSPQLGCFWEKLDGEKYRRKLRFRRYGTGDAAFVEIKQRLDRTVQKRRVLWPLERVRRVFESGSVGSELADDERDAVAQEALFLCHRLRLEPKMAVRYRRRAYFAKFEPDLRVTFDSRLQFDAHALDIGEPFETGRYLLAPDRSILEIKFNHRVPHWLIALVQKHNLELRRFSKYCAAVDLAVYGGRHLS